MSSNAFGAFTSPAKARSGAGEAKKKKKKRKKKKNKSKGGGGPAANDDARVVALLARGYDRDMVHRCFDLMFEAGEDLADDKVLMKRLNAMKNGGGDDAAESKASKSTSASTSGASSSRRVQREGGSARADNSDSKDAGRHGTEAASGSLVDNGSGSTTSAATTKSVTSSEASTSSSTTSSSSSSTSPSSSSTTTNSSSSSSSASSETEAPLAARLEQATEMPVAVVLPVLTKWCRNYESDRAVLFESKALTQLFEHYLQDRIKGETEGSVHDKYEKPMAELLGLALSQSATLAAEVSSQLTKLVASAQTMSLASSERSAVCKAFSAHLVSRIRNFHRATSYDESLPSKLAQLDNNLKQNYDGIQAVEAALAQDSTSLARMFELRDMRSERADLQAKKSTLLEFINGGGDGASRGGKVRSGSSGGSENRFPGHSLSNVSGKSGDMLLVGVGFASAAVSEAAESQAKGSALRGEISRIEEDHRKKLSSVSADISQATAAADALREQAAALAAQLKACEEKLASTLVKRAALEASQSDIEAAFEKRLTSLNESNSGLVGHIRRGEAQAAVVEQLRALDRCVDESISQAAKSLSGAQRAQRQLLAGAAGGSLIKSRMETVRSAITYAKAERACLDRIRGRMHSAKAEIAKLEREVAMVEQLGLKKVEKQMRHSIEEHTQNHAEDAGLVAHLENQARQTLGQLKAVVGRMMAQNNGTVSSVVSAAVHEAKEAFISLACCGAEADGWELPDAERKGSFDADKANALGLSALLPRGFDDAHAAATSDAATKQQKPPTAAPVAKPAATPVFRGWGVPTASGKSLAEEMAQKH